MDAYGVEGVGGIPARMWKAAYKYSAGCRDEDYKKLCKIQLTELTIRGNF